MEAKVSTRSGELESRWTTAGGSRMHARVSADRPSEGGGVPVVLVHGLVVSGLYMVPTAERLVPFYMVCAPDLPGFGKSDKPARALDVTELADALGAWMDAEGLGPAVLVGNSLGCQVIADMAARGPHRVAGLVLTGPTVDPAGRTLYEQFKRLLVDATRERFSIVFTWLRGFGEAGPTRAWQTSRYALENRIEENLPRIHAPALVVRGARDPIAPQAWAEQVTRLLPRGRLAVVPGGPHALNYSTPDELALLIREFIEGEVFVM
jgi:2-hydroxy-6-oxonona-2,4-dienedioate hydrolase